MTRATVLRMTLLAAFSAAALYATQAAAQDAYKIGIISPLSGANARYGAFANKGANLAAKEITPPAACRAASLSS